LEQTTRISTRRLSQETDVSRSLAMHTMHQDLRLFPYEIQISQLETDANKAERRAFGNFVAGVL